MTRSASGKASNKEQCSICQDNLSNPCALPCGNVFCTRCISTWLRDNTTCPLCRHEVPPTVRTGVIGRLTIAKLTPYGALTYTELERKRMEYSDLKARLSSQRTGDNNQGVENSAALLSLLDEQIVAIVERQLFLLGAAETDNLRRLEVVQQLREERRRILEPGRRLVEQAERPTTVRTPQHRLSSIFDMLKNIRHRASS